MHPHTEDFTLPAKQPEANVSELSIGAVAPGQRPIKHSDPVLNQILQDGEEQPEQPQYVSEFASFISRRWQHALNAKQGKVEENMLAEMLQRRDEYTEAQKQRIKEAGGEEVPFTPCASRVADALVEWVRVTMSQVNPGDKLWSLKPTPIPELPEDVQEALVNKIMFEHVAPLIDQGAEIDPQAVRDMTVDMKGQILQAMKAEASESCERMERLIEDQLVEGGFMTAFDEVIEDLGDAQTAFMRGPIITRRPKRKFVRGLDGQSQMQMEEELAFEFHRVSQLDIYPAPNARAIDDRYIFYRMRMTDTELSALRGAKSVDTKAIEELIYGRMYSEQYKEGVDSSRDGIEGRDGYSNGGDYYEILEYWGEVHGRDLMEWGTPGIQDPTQIYHAQVWFSTRTRKPIRVVLNPSADGRPLIWGVSVYPQPDAVWGRSLQNKAMPSQKMVNAYQRANVDNLNEAAKGKLALYRTDLLDEAVDPTTDYGGKIWSFQGDSGVNYTQKPMEYFYTPRIQGLAEALEAALNKVHDDTGIPKVITSAAPQGGTASGMAMVLDSAGKKVRNLLHMLDVGILEPVLQWMYMWNMAFHPDDSVKGDMKVVPQGVLEMVRKEAMGAKAAQILPLVSASPVVGAGGHAALIYSLLQNSNIDPEGIMPRDKVKMLQDMDEMQMLQPPPPDVVGDPGNPEDEQSVGAEPPLSVSAKPNTPIETPQAV